MSSKTATKRREPIGVPLLTLLWVSDSLRGDRPRVLGTSPRDAQVGFWRPWAWAARRR